MTNSIGATAEGLRDGHESCPLRTCPKAIPPRCGTWKPELPELFAKAGLMRVAMEGERDPIRLSDGALERLLPATTWREAS